MAILNFQSCYEFPAMLVVCGWSVWTPPVIWVWHTTWHCCSTPPFSKSHMSLIWDLIWGVIWYHMSSNELIWAQMISYELIWHLIWDLIWAQMRLDRGIEKFEVEKCRWHFSINHDVVKQPAKYEFIIPSSFEVRIWLVNRLSLIFKESYRYSGEEFSFSREKENSW